ncbi:carbohydrate-binding module family 18 protein [Amniculicola lignicola CBS 123094]|uniref:chitinase n=1 Tax=Amniculicola lignicola CBS 123094 TaxID=1392246 RepID=A0A6A5WY43_9PLEO|nr:carbohydrate-binding module family 18 protein [Amniculicola lignicola CBS 123094]
MRLLSVALLAPALLAASVTARFIVYADEWHLDRPTSAADRAGIDHVVIAFAQANKTATWVPNAKQPVALIRQEYPNAKVMVAIGGWGDTVGFSEAVKTPAGIEKFAADVQTLIQVHGLDGVDIDWEYPGGNGADYKQVPNSSRTNEIEAFPELLKAVRTAIGEDKLLSIAVPGKEIDMIAFTPEQGPKIWPSVDYINIMTYDLMNRRDAVTAHHTSVAGSAAAIENYLNIGAPPEKINLGFAFYAKYFTTASDCTNQPLGCPIEEAEDPVTGSDTLKSGAWTFEKWHMTPVDGGALPVSTDGTCGAEKGTKCASGCCSQYGNCGTSKEHCSGACQHAFGIGCTDSDVAGSWQRAKNNGVYDEEEGGQYYFDADEKLFWTWDTPEIISRKFEEIVKTYGLGGVMAWSLGEDTFDYSHVRQIAEELKASEINVVLNDGTDEKTASDEAAPEEEEDYYYGEEETENKPTEPQADDQDAYNEFWDVEEADGRNDGLTGENWWEKLYSEDAEGAVDSNTAKGNVESTAE